MYSIYNSNARGMKAQTSLMLIVVLILVFIGLAVFLLSFASTLDQQDYFNLYTNNMIITVMRSDTGYHDSKCRLVSDAVSCAFFSPFLALEYARDSFA